MHLPIRFLLILSMTVGCGEEAPKEDTCTTLCKELTEECNFAAYPDLESCQEGCLYYEEEGVNVEDHLACVSEASCDTFRIVECEHSHGVTND